MDIQKKKISVNMPVTEFSTSVIADTDAIVSDSKPDLLKVIDASPMVTITKSEISNGKMTIGGRVCFQILYQPENAQGVCGMFASADFSHLEENSCFGDGMQADITSTCEHVEWELINSRKIKLRCVIGLNVNVCHNASLHLPVQVSGDNIRVKCETFGGYESILNKRDIITLSDSLVLPAGKPCIGSILKFDALLLNKDIKVISGKVIIKGDVEINSLYTPEGTTLVESCSHNLPFTEILDAEGIGETDICRIKADIETSDFSLATDSDDDIRIINPNIRIGVKIRAFTPINETIVTDAYSLTDNLKINYTPISFKKSVCDRTMTHTLKHSVSTGNISGISNISGSPFISECVPLENSAVLDGYIDLSMICTHSDEICPATAHHEEIPFKINLDMPGCNPNSEISADIEISDINYILNPAGGVDLKLILSCTTEAFETGVTDVADSIETVGPVETKSPSIVLYFVQKGDTLWDIAKRYHTKTEYIEELNGDAVSPLVCGSQILIPRS